MIFRFQVGQQMVRSQPKLQEAEDRHIKSKATSRKAAGNASES
jgi:hypothetical protein